MNNIEEEYQFSLRVEEKINNILMKTNCRRGHGGRSDGWSYSDQNVDKSQLLGK